MDRERPDWLVRLTDEIRKRTKDADTLSMRRLSKDSGVGINYVTQLLGPNWRSPGFDKVVGLTRAMRISITYIVTGTNLTHEEEELLSYWASIDAQQRERLLDLLRSFPQDNAPSQ